MGNRIIRGVAVSGALILGLLFVPVTTGAAKKKPVTISAEKATVNVTNYKQLKLKNLPKNKSAMVTWSSSDNAVAFVSKKGKVFAYKKGKAKICATYKKKKYICRLTVKQGKSGLAYMLEPDRKPNDGYHYRWRFEDCLFDDGTVYQKDLAVASTLLAIASTPDSSVDPTKQSHRVEELLSVMGFGRYDVNEDYKKRPEEDTFGTAFAAKTIHVGKKDYCLVAVVPRSSGYGTEWVNNLNIGVTGDHAGFSMERDKLIRDLENYLSGHGITGHIKLFFTGHSRGAIVGNLIEGYLADHPEALSGVTIHRDDIYGYNISTIMASDAAGDNGAGESGYEFVHNILMPYDLIHRMVPPEYGMKRFGVDHHISYTEAELKDNLKQLKETNQQLYDMYRTNSPDIYAENLIRKILQTLLYMNPTREVFMKQTYPPLRDLILSGVKPDLATAMKVLNSDFGKSFVKAMFLSGGEPVPEDLFTEDGNFNLGSPSVTSLISEFMKVPSVFVQHYVEVTYCFLD